MTIHSTSTFVSLFVVSLFSLSACGGSRGTTEKVDDVQANAYTPSLEYDAYSPQISAYGEDRALVVWRQNDPSRLALYSSVLNTPSWSDTQLIVENNNEDATLARTAINTTGEAVTVWVQWNGNRYTIWANIYSPTLGWLGAERIDTDNTGNALYPDVAINASGEVLVIWNHSDNSLNTSRIVSNHYSQATNSGWRGETTVSTLILHAAPPRIALNDNGFAIALWEQPRNGWTAIYSLNYNSDNTEAWDDTPQPIGVNNNSHAYSPRLSMNNQGIAHSVWLQSDGSYNQVWTNRYTPASSWDESEIISLQSENNSYSPRIATDGNGNALALWQQIDEKRENNSQVKIKESIWANHYTETSGWSEPQLIETNDDSNAYSPEVTFNAQGNAIAVWSQKAVHSDDSKIWLNRFTASTLEWDSAEIICHANNRHASNPKLANTQGTRTLIAWEFSGEEEYACDEKTGKNAANSLQRIHIDWLQ